MNGEKDPETCDSCHTPLRVGERKKRVFIRRIIDPISNKIFVMCNACGLRLSRAGWRSKKDYAKTKPTGVVEKEVCLKEFEVFTQALCGILQDNGACRLCCPVIAPKLCQCIQRYLTLDSNVQVSGVRQLLQGNFSECISKEKANELNELHKKAKQLIKMKAPKPVNRELTSSEVRGVKNLRTKEYEEFVLINRERLKRTCSLCERGVQRILCYSNNYLHKQLKTSPNGEARIAGKSTVVAKLLPDIETLSEKKCCKRRCTRLALTHSRLIERWRTRALLGQRDARAVLAEMLTPAGGAVNCSTFLHLVTGCRPGLLNKVKKDLKQSDGIREPPEHGLREYWRRKKINAARNRDVSKSSYSDTNIGSFAFSTLTNGNAADSSCEAIQARRPVILKTNSATNNFDYEKTVSKNASDDFVISRNSNSDGQYDTNLNIDTADKLSNIVIHSLLNNNTHSSNYNQSNALPLPLTSSDNIDVGASENVHEDICNDNGLSLMQSVLMSPVTKPIENTSSTLYVSNDIKSGTEEGNGQPVQFIEITKLLTEIPPSTEESVPMNSMIILPPGCVLLNDSLIVTTS